MINYRVYFGKGKIKGIVAISRKYWDEGDLSFNEDKILFNGERVSTEILKAEIKSVNLVKHRVFKVIRITKHNDEFYHISSVPDIYTPETFDPETDFSYAEQVVKRQNKVLYNEIEQFLNK